MIVEVGEHKLKIDKSPVNELEVNITKIEFEFPSSMDGLVKKAFFTQEDVSKEVLLLTNECDIPSEVLFKQGQVRLGVIAYETDGNVLKERFNPTPCYFQVDEGSLIDADNTEPITPTDKEQIEQALTNLQNNKQDTLVSGENIKTINNESLLGSGNLEVITDLSDYYTKEQTNDLLDTKQDKTSMNEYYKKTETYSDDEVDTLLSEYTKTSDLSSVALSNDYDDLDNKPDLSVYSLITETGNKIDLEINSSTYVLTAKLYDKNNNLISTSTGIDLPLETMVVGASYDSATKEIILTLKNGQEVRFSVADLVSGLQTEITSDNMLSSDLVDDTNHTHKFVSSSDITNWNNKSDFSGSYNDLTNKPDLTLKEDKSNKVASISSSSTDTQYPSAKCVYDGQATQDTQIEELQQENDYLNSIIDQLPKVNGTGDTITLNNTIEAKMKSKLSPSEMTQETTTGKNKLNNLYAYSSGYEKTDNGIKYIINADGSITISGTATALSSFNTLGTGFGSTTIIEPLDNTKNYTLSTSTLQSGVSIYARVYDGTNLETKLTSTSITFTEKTGLTAFYIQVANGTTISGNLTIYPQLEEGTTATNWEKYTNGASPNPQYPQDIHTTTGDNVIRDEGKNLFNPTYQVEHQFLATGVETGGGNNGYALSNGIITSSINVSQNGRRLFNKTKLKAGTYSVSGKVKFINATQYYMYNSVRDMNTLEDIKPSFEINVGNAIGTFEFQFTLNEDKENVSISLQPMNTNCGTLELTNIQLEIGSSATSYLPYTLDTYPLNLGNLEYSKIGNYEDEFIYNTTDTNLELNKWYLKKNISKFVLNGTEANWNLFFATNGIFVNTSLINGIPTDSTINCMSDYYKATTRANIRGNLATIDNACSVFGVELVIANKNLSTTTDLSNWLSTNNTTIDYIRANPEYIPLNDTLQEQLTNIYNNMMSKKGQTNISQVNDDLPMVITASALLDLNILVQ